MHRILARVYRYCQESKSIFIRMILNAGDYGHETRAFVREAKIAAIAKFASALLNALLRTKDRCMYFQLSVSEFRKYSVFNSQSEF